jgi:hypothetical protein
MEIAVVRHARQKGKRVLRNAHAEHFKTMDIMPNELHVVHADAESQVLANERNLVLACVEWLGAEKACQDVDDVHANKPLPTTASDLVLRRPAHSQAF